MSIPNIPSLTLKQAEACVSGFGQAVVMPADSAQRAAGFDCVVRIKVGDNYEWRPTHICLSLARLGYGKCTTTRLKKHGIIPS